MRLNKKAKLAIHQKLTSPKGLLREIYVWEIPPSIQYPEGVKYRLVLVHPKTGVVYLLYDNHWPKGHHVHIDGKEEKYEFNSTLKLVREFRTKADKIEEFLYEDQKD